MLVACFVLIGNYYFNTNTIVYIKQYKGSLEITNNKEYQIVYTKETAKEVVERINKECSKK